VLSKASSERLEVRTRLPNVSFNDADDRGPFRIVSVEHDVDLAARTEFEDALSTVDGRPLIVDLSACPYLDSTGLTALIRRHSSGSHMAIVIPEGCAVERVFTLTKMDRVFNVFQTIERAANALTYAGD